MKRIIKLTERDLTRIVKRIINEDNLQGGGFGADRDESGNKLGTGYRKKTATQNQVYTFDNTNMKTGTDTIDTTTRDYSNLLFDIKNILKDKQISSTTVTVTGGASSVGKNRGFDNEALAKRRANNLIAQLKKDIPNIDSKIDFITNTKVGTATEKDSKEALDQQFVKVNFSKSVTSPVGTIELDNTAVDLNLKKIDIPNNKFVFEKRKRLCVQLPEGSVNDIKKLIKKYQTDNNIKYMPIGVYDV